MHVEPGDATNFSPFPALRAHSIHVSCNLLTIGTPKAICADVLWSTRFFKLCSNGGMARLDIEDYIVTL